MFQHYSCLVRFQLYPDRQRMFICACSSVIRTMKSDVCTWSLVRKLYCTCRCNMRTSVSWTSSESKFRCWNQIDSMFPFSSESKSETLSRSIQMSSESKSKIRWSADVAEFLVRDEFSDSSFSIHKKRRGFCFLFLFAKQASYHVRRECVRFAVLDLLTTDRILSFAWSDSDYDVVFAVVSETSIIVIVV